MDPLTLGVLAASVIVALAGASIVALRGWNGWLEFKKMELTHSIADGHLPPAGNRIELADLKERVRKLEAIAAGIDI
jgi:hypothetical protein